MGGAYSFSGSRCMTVPLVSSALALPLTLVVGSLSWYVQSLLQGLTEGQLRAALAETCVCSAASCPAHPEVATTLVTLLSIGAAVASLCLLVGGCVGVAVGLAAGWVLAVRRAETAAGGSPPRAPISRQVLGTLGIVTPSSRAAALDA